MFRFVKRIFVSAMMFFGCSLSSVNPLKCVSMNNQECKVRPEIVNVNSVLFSIIFTVNIGIGAYFTYFYWYLKKDIGRVKFNIRAQITI